MQEQLVSFETAKLAKEKAFNECCSYYFDGNNKPDTQVDYANYKNEYGYTTAPTQSLLQKWLREIHNILVEVTINPGYGFWKVSWCIIRGLDNHPRYKSSSSEWKIVGYSYYEQALEAGLQEALKLIK